MSHTDVAIRLRSMRVVSESNESSDSDEPYVIVFVANVSPTTVGNARTVRYGPWADADDGELLTTRNVDGMDDRAIDAMRQFIVVRDNAWGPGGEPAPIADPDDLVILVAVCEHDERNTGAVRSMVNSLMAGALANVVRADLTRAELRARLLDDFRGVVDQALVSENRLNLDERVGQVRELRVTDDDLEALHHRESIIKKLSFNGGSEGSYRVAFEIVRG